MRSIGDIVVSVSGGGGGIAPRWTADDGDLIISSVSSLSESDGDWQVTDHWMPSSSTSGNIEYWIICVLVYV